MIRISKFISYFICGASISLLVLINFTLFVHTKALTVEPKLVLAQAQILDADPFPVTRQTTTASNSLLKLPPNQGKPVEVAVGLYIANLADIDQTKETYDLSSYLFATWKDTRLAFNPQEVTADTKVYKLGEIWDPHLIGVNTVEGRRSFNDSLTVKPDGTVQYQERFHITLSASFQLSLFPFDTQMLPVILRSFDYAGDQVVFLVDNQKSGWDKAEYVGLSEWRIDRLEPTVYLSVFAPEKTEYSRIVFQLIVKRNAGYYIWTFFLPLLLINIISWTVFWINIETEFNTRISIGISSLLSAIAFNITIGTNLPRVGYLTCADSFIFFSYIFISLSIFATVYGHYFIVFKGRKEKVIAIENSSRWIFPLGFTLGNLFLFAFLALK